MCRRHFESAGAADHEYRREQEVAPKHTREQGNGDHHSRQRASTLCQVQPKTWWQNSFHLGFWPMR
jgi:hypothetical protein